MPPHPEALLRTIAQNVQNLRRSVKWSQQELAERSNVSLRMIGLIESGENNVSLATLGSLAAALNVTFSDLVNEASLGGPAPERPRRGVRLWQGRNAGTKVDLLQSFPATHVMELWKWTVAEGDRYQGEPDLPGYVEIVYVIRGELTLELEHETQVLKAGDTLKFPSDRPYAFSNTGKGSLTFTLNVVA
jgi:transcriptional regulator with XRE-family HTH domain